MSEGIQFIANGTPIALTRADVTKAMRGVRAEPIQVHSVNVDGTDYPVKQVFEAATGLDRLDFTTTVARRKLARLGFEVARA